MSVASELQQLRLNLENAYRALKVKGAILPIDQNFDNLSATISNLDITVNDRANVINAINYTGITLAKGAKVWISMENPITSSVDGYYIINFNDGVDNSCYSAITSADCQPLASVDVFTVLDSNTMTAASNDDYTYEVID